MVLCYLGVYKWKHLKVCSNWLLVHINLETQNYFKAVLAVLRLAISILIYINGTGNAVSKYFLLTKNWTFTKVLKISSNQFEQYYVFTKREQYKHTLQKYIYVAILYCKWSMLYLGTYYFTCLWTWWRKCSD